MAYPIALSSLSCLYLNDHHQPFLLLHFLLVQLLQALTPDDLELLVGLRELLTHLALADLILAPYLKLLVPLMP